MEDTTLDGYAEPRHAYAGTPPRPAKIKPPKPPPRPEKKPKNK